MLSQKQSTPNEGFTGAANSLLSTAPAVVTVPGPVAADPSAPQADATAAGAPFSIDGYLCRTLVDYEDVQSEVIAQMVRWLKTAISFDVRAEWEAIEEALRIAADADNKWLNAGPARAICATLGQQLTYAASAVVRLNCTDRSQHDNPQVLQWWIVQFALSHLGDRSAVIVVTESRSRLFPNPYPLTPNWTGD